MNWAQPARTLPAVAPLSSAAAGLALSANNTFPTGFGPPFSEACLNCFGAGLTDKLPSPLIQIPPAPDQIASKPILRRI